MKAFPEPLRGVNDHHPEPRKGLSRRSPGGLPATLVPDLRSRGERAQTPSARSVPLTPVDPDLQADLAILDTTLTTVERVLDVDGLRGRIANLEQEASDPKLWDDPKQAQAVMQERHRLDEAVAAVNAITRERDDTVELMELAEAEDDGGGVGRGDRLGHAVERAEVEARGVQEHQHGTTLAHSRGGFP